MFKEKQNKSEVDYEKDFKIVIGTNPANDSQLKVHQLKSLESFSRSSESLALSVTSIGEHPKLEKDRRKKKTRSASRGKKGDKEKPCDYGVSRDSGESFMSGILANVRLDEWSVMGESDVEQLRLTNLRLESKLNVTIQASEDGLREQAKLRCELKTAKKEVTNRTENLEELRGEQKHWFHDKELLSEHKSELEKRVSLLQAEVAQKTHDCKNISEQLILLQDTARMHERSVASVRDDVAMKEAIIGDLKKKVCELHSQLELVKLYRENSEYQAEQVRLELDMVNNTRRWVEEQLHTVEAVRDQLQGEVQRVRRCLDESCGDRESLEQRNQSLEARLKRMADARLFDTTQLLFELEQLQRELIVSGDEKDSLTERYEALTAIFETKSHECEEACRRSRDLESEYGERCLELTDSAEQLRRSKDELALLESEAGELRTRLAVCEVDLAQRLAAMQSLANENVSLEDSLLEWRAVAADKDLRIDELSEQLTNVRYSLERVTTERDQSALIIAQLRDDCEKVADQFELTRQALCEKEESLRAMGEMCNQMREELAVSERVADTLRHERDQLAASCVLLQASHGQVREELDNLRQSLAETHLRMAGMEEELASYEMASVTNRGTEAELVRVKAELIAAEQRIDMLSEVQGECAELLERVNDMQARLCDRESALTRMESEMDKTRDELETVKFNHVIELANRETQYRERLNESEREFSQMCQEKIRCESAIGSLQTHINSLVEDYNERMTQCRTKMASLEEKSTAYADYEQKSRHLMDELARRKGEIEGVLNEWKKMKRHAAVLETALARREASIVDLADKHAITVTEKENQIREMTAELRQEREARAEDANINGARLTYFESQVAAMNSLNRQLSEYENRHESLAQELDKYKYLEQTWHDETRLMKDTCEQVTAELQRKYDENRDLMTANQRLMSELSLMKLTEDTGNKCMRSLQQDLEQRSQRIEAEHKKRLKLIERNKTEKGEMKSVVKDVQREKESLTRTAELSQQREIIASSILSQVRSELKRILFDYTDNSATLSGDQFQQLHQLLTDTEVPLKTSRPLSRLTKCIDELRTKIDSMQDEVITQFNEESANQ